MILHFADANGEFIKLDIDRVNKKLKFTGRKTNYAEQELPFYMLWDKGKEKEQEKIAEPLNDKDFVDVLEKQMNIYGYKLVKKDGL